MKYTLDLHLHSKYARACSPNLVFENMAYWAQIKGVDVLGTGDFTHPARFSEMQEKLYDCGNGLFKLKKPYDPSEKNVMPVVGINNTKTFFMLQTEVSCIYRKNDKTRRLHLLIFAPNMKAVEKINKKLGSLGKLASDGRPILGLDAKELAKIVFDADEKCMVIPAHAWTPWFAVFGSKSGFDSLQECFDELTPHIHAIETGLSSDPLMNYQISKLDKITLISNSDAHSCSNIAREANVMSFDEISYDKVCNAIKSKNKSEFLYTIEFYPEEGMYHIDGHRECKFSCEPEETIKNKGKCLVCKKELTVGVLSRVEELADRDYGFVPQNAIPHKSIVGLDDIIAEGFEVKGRKSKKVLNVYQKLVEKLGSELKILLDVPIESLEGVCDSKIIEGIKRNRQGNLHITPGFDGQYGQVKVFSKKDSLLHQKQLFEIV